MTAQTTPPEILLISSAEIQENIDINNNFVQKLNAELGGTCIVEWQNYHNIGLEIQGNSLRAFIVSDGRELTEFKAVYFKSYFRHHEQATSIAEALQSAGVLFVGNELKEYIPAYKLSQLSRLARSGVLVPHTLYLPMKHYESHYETLQEKFGQQFIFKAIDGSTGDSNYLVKNRKQLAKIVADSQGQHYIAQEFIPNNSDLRVLVVGGKIRLVIERRRADDSTHLNNTSQGAKACLLPIESLSEELQELSLRAAKLMSRDIAGVDVMFQKNTGTPYILEVNASPQIASGTYETEKLKVYADYFRELAKA